MRQPGLYSLLNTGRGNATVCVYRTIWQIRLAAALIDRTNILCILDHSGDPIFVRWH